MTLIDSELSIAVSQLRALHSSIQSLLVAKNVPRIMWSRYLPDLSSSVFLNMQLQKVNCQTLYDKLFAYENGKAAKDVRFDCIVREIDQLRFELQALRIKYFKSLMSERYSPEDARKIVIYEDKEMNERMKRNQERLIATTGQGAQRPEIGAYSTIMVLNAAAYTDECWEEQRYAALQYQLKTTHYQAHSTCTSLVSAIRACFANVAQQGDAIYRAVQQVCEVSVTVDYIGQQSSEAHEFTDECIKGAQAAARLAASLHGEVEDLRQGNSALQQKLQHSEQSNFLLAQASAVWKAQVAYLEAGQRELEKGTQVHQVEQQQSAKLFYQVEYLTKMLGAQEHTAEIAEAAREYAISACRAAERDRRAILEQCEALRVECTVASRECQVLREQMIATAASAEETQASLQSQLYQACCSYKATNEALSAAYLTVQQKEREMVAFEHRLAAYQAQIEQFQVEAAKYQNEYAYEAKAFSSSVQRQDQLEQQLAAAEACVSEANTAAQQHADHVYVLEQQLAAQERAVHEQKELYALLEGQIKAKKAGTKPRKPQRDVCSRCKALQMQVEMLQRVLQGGNSDVIEIIEEKGIWQRRVDELQAENDCLQRILRAVNKDRYYSLPIVDGV